MNKENYEEHKNADGDWQPIDRDIALLELYSTWLEKNGYLDSDWWAEEPKAIDKFIKETKISV